MRSKHPKEKLLEQRYPDDEEEDIVLESEDASTGGDVFAATDRRIKERFAGVDFGIDKSHKFMHGYNEIVHIAVPVLMTVVVGIETAYVVMGNGFKADSEHILGLVGAIMGVIAIEAISLSITFQLATAKQEKDQDTARGRQVKANYKSLKVARIGLTCVEALGQSAFLVLMFFSDKGVNGNAWVYVLLVVIRTVGLVVSDIYPAFWHMGAPTTAQKRLAEDKQQSEAVIDAYKMTEEQLRIASRARKEVQDEVYRAKQLAQEAEFSARSRQREMERRERRELALEQAEEEERRMLQDMKRQKLLGNGRGNDADDD
jgi:hypothetical protein